MQNEVLWLPKGLTLSFATTQSNVAPKMCL